MRILLSSIILASGMMSCSKPKNELAQSLFGDPQRFSLDKHYYTYSEGGKIVKDRVVTYEIFDGTLVDSMDMETSYFYDTKGRLIKKEDDSGREAYVYNDKDSLVGHYAISGNADTISLIENVFNADGQIQKHVSRHLFQQTDIESALESVQRYDTLFRLEEYFYVDGILQEMVIKDAKGNLTEERQYYYKDMLLASVDTYAYFGDEKYLRGKDVYVYRLKAEEPDMYSINNDGDTVNFFVTGLDDGFKIRKLVFVEALIADFLYYKDNRLIGSIRYDMIAKLKGTSTYTYDNYGNKKEEKRYSEAISDWQSVKNKLEINNDISPE